MGHTRVRSLTVVLCLVQAIPAAAADVAPRAPVVRDGLAPTVPRGFAADLPRSPLVDTVVNAGLRFDSVEEARRHCPGDAIVRVEPFTATYRPAGPRGPGVFMCEAAAMQEGDLPR